MHFMVPVMLVTPDRTFMAKVDVGPILGPLLTYAMPITQKIRDSEQVVSALMALFPHDVTKSATLQVDEGDVEIVKLVETLEAANPTQAPLIKPRCCWVYPEGAPMPPGDVCPEGVAHRVIDLKTNECFGFLCADHGSRWKDSGSRLDPPLPMQTAPADLGPGGGVRPLLPPTVPPPFEKTP